MTFMVAGIALASSLAAAATSLVLLQAAHDSATQVDLTERRVARLREAVAQAKTAAADAPAVEVFAALRDRITALNALDYGATPSVGGLLDTLEQTLPNDAVLINMDYDRNKGAADLVATSTNSQELTRLFDVLDDHAMFSKVRLLDKKQVAAAGTSQTQVHLLLDVGHESRASRGGTR
ncbi:MAG: hypothetical protein Q7T86_16930 [Hyphomicrobiaceae bacterium]|nr:hypothetical protein [Hyphomicrobiaceae bacterium]